MSQTLKLSELLLPKGKKYIRGIIDQKNLADLLIIAKDAKHTGYPFSSPITVRRIAKPKKDGPLYEVMDGVTRSTALIEIGAKTVEADVKNLDDKAAAIFQWTSNMDHGIRINRKQRATWIRHMKLNLGMKLAEISKLVGLTETSVSRIARFGEKHGVTSQKGKSKSTPKTSTNGATAPKDEKKPGPWTPVDFFARVRGVGNEAGEHVEALKVYARQHAREIIKLMEPMQDLINAAMAVEASAAK